MRRIRSCAVIALALTLSACGKAPTTKPITGSENKSAPSSNPKITFENAKQIKQGMTLREINAILGEEPKSDGAAGAGKAKYSWTGAGGKSIHLTLQNEKISGFVSFSDPAAGPVDNPKVTKKNAAKVKRGLTLAEVKAILGEPRSFVILLDPAKSTIFTETYSWLDYTKQSSAVIGFSKRRVSTLPNYVGPG